MIKEETGGKWNKYLYVYMYHVDKKKHMLDNMYRVCKLMENSVTIIQKTRFISFYKEIEWWQRKPPYYLLCSRSICEHFNIISISLLFLKFEDKRRFVIIIQFFFKKNWVTYNWSFCKYFIVTDFSHKCQHLLHSLCKQTKCQRDILPKNKNAVWHNICTY